MDLCEVSMKSRTGLALLGVLLASTLVLQGCSPLYVLRAGYEQARILQARRPIADVVADPATPPEVRRKLDLVVQARTYAASVLDLDAGDSYTTFSRIDRDTLALVVSAARRDRLEAITWWFPIVGRVPYKGFFNPDRARAEAERLDRRGYDVYLRTVGAFSTLGWFNDPLLSTMLRYDDVGLASTVIHELTHNTIFIPGRVSFNESFATFVGDRGAIDFFCTRDGEEAATCQQASDEWHDNVLFARYLGEVIAALEEVYARENLDVEARVAARDQVFQAAQQRYADHYADQARTTRFQGMSRARLDNARILAWRLYYDRLHLFDAALAAHDGDLPAAVRRIITAAEATPEDPFAALAALNQPP
jgi:predicted aminopeptidase